MTPPPSRDSVWLDAVALVFTAVVCLGILLGVIVLIVGYVLSHQRIHKMGEPVLLGICVTGIVLALSLAYAAFHLGRRHARRRRKSA